MRRCRGGRREMSEDPAQKRPSVVSVRAVVFDYGEVLCHPPTTQDMERMAAVVGIPTEIFRVLYSDRGRYDRGDVTAAVYWSKVASGAGVRVNDKTLEQLRDWDRARIESCRQRRTPTDD